jgi:uncharacterized membrane protein
MRRSSLLVIIAFTLVAAVYTGARLWHLTAACLWFDEIFSVHAARYGWGRMISFVAADVVHPPLFYALLKVWIGIGGESLLWLRLLPVLFSVAAIVPLLLLCRELRLDAAVAGLALLLMAVNGYLIKYAQEVRMYSLLLFLTLTSLWLFAKFLRVEEGSNRWLAALSVINLLLVYTHYYGWMVVAVELLYLLLRGRAHWRRFFISVVLLMLCFSPWAYAVLSAERGQGLAQNIGWAARPRLADLAQFYVLLHQPFIYQQSSAERPFPPWSFAASLLLFGLPLLALLWQEFKKKRLEGTRVSDNLTWLLWFSVLPILTALVLSWVLPQSIWGTRHLIIVAAPYAILASVAVNRLRPAVAKHIVVLVFCCWLLLAGAATQLRREGNYIWCAWGELAEQMPSSESGKVYAFEVFVAYHLWFAVGERSKVVVIKGLPGLREDTAYFLPRAFDDIAVQAKPELSGERLWLAFRDTALDEGREPLKTAKAQGYEVRNVLSRQVGRESAFLVEMSMKP